MGSRVPDQDELFSRLPARILAMRGPSASYKLVLGALIFSSDVLGEDGPCREVLATMSGTSISTVSAALGAWRRLGEVDFIPDRTKRSGRRYALLRRPESPPARRKSASTHKSPGARSLGASAQDLRASAQTLGALPIREREERETEDVSSPPPSPQSGPEPPPGETRRDVSPSPIEDGDRAEPGPAPRRLDPARAERAREVIREFRRRFGYTLEAREGGASIAWIPIPGEARDGGPDPELLGRARDLKPEIAAVLLGGPEVLSGAKPPPVPRDPAYPIEPIVAAIRRGGPDMPGRVAGELTARWLDAGNPITRRTVRRAATYLLRDAFEELVLHAERKDDPARWFAVAAAEEIRAAGKGNRPRVPLQEPPRPVAGVSA